MKSNCTRHPWYLDLNPVNNWMITGNGIIVAKSDETAFLKDPGQGLANAKLMVKAPELLNAVASARTYIKYKIDVPKEFMIERLEQLIKEVT